MTNKPIFKFAARMLPADSETVAWQRQLQKRADEQAAQLARARREQQKREAVAALVARRLIEAQRAPEPTLANSILGRTMRSVTADDDSVTFVRTDGRTFRLYHHQDCCESVYVESIVGDLSDLVGSPVMTAEESTSTSDDGSPAEPPADSSDSSYTWTFYKFATIKGYVDIRFYGASNGYYSESVDFGEVT